MQKLETNFFMHKITSGDLEEVNLFMCEFIYLKEQFLLFMTKKSKE